MGLNQGEDARLFVEAARRRWSAIAGIVALVALGGGWWYAATAPTEATFELRNETDLTARGQMRLTDGAGSILVDTRFSIAPGGVGGLSYILADGEAYAFRAQAVLTQPDAWAGNGRNAGASTIVNAEQCRLGALVATLYLSEGEQRPTSTRCDL